MRENKGAGKDITIVIAKGGPPSLDDTDRPRASTRCNKCNGYGRLTPPEITTEYEVDEIAGYNKNITDIYIDSRLPEVVGGVPVKKSIPIHEIVEVVLEEWLGFSYNHAHMMAQAAEDKYVEICGVDAKAYEKEWAKWIKKLEHTAKDTPPDIINPNKVKGR